MARVAETIRAWTGLTFPAIRVRDVEATITREMGRRRITDVSAFLHLLREDVPVRDALVAELTIGETYFLRDPRSSRCCASGCFPSCSHRDRADRSVRVWSAGCASGEEPYSGRDAVRRAGRPRADIVGTDIARPRLAHAQRGIYSKWSLRGSRPKCAPLLQAARALLRADARIRGASTSAT
jgi:chemotaxis protein methyltransferase CheR